MIDEWLTKSKLKNGLENFSKKLFYGKISPNQLTILGLMIGILSADFFNNPSSI